MVPILQMLWILIFLLRSWQFLPVFSASFKGRSDSMSKNKLLVPEAQQAINDLKTEIAQELGMPVINGTTSNMYPAIVNGLSVREMVRRGEQMLINKKAPSDTDIY